MPKEDFKKQLDTLEIKFAKVIKDLTEKDTQISNLIAEKDKLESNNKKINEKSLITETALAKLTDVNEITRINKLTDTLLTKDNYTFKNIFERNGFDTAIFVKKEDGSYQNDENIIKIVKDFLQEQVSTSNNTEEDKNKKDNNTADNENKEKDKNKISNKTELITELRTLLAKPNLTAEDVTRIENLQKELN